MNVSLIRQRFAAAMERGMSVADATAYANSLYGPLRTPGKIAAPEQTTNNKGAYPEAGISGNASPVETPDGTPIPIPEDWESLHWTQQVKLAEELIAGEIVVSGHGETKAQKAHSIILATVLDRANPPANPA